ncbi:MAG: YggT family protein [Actinomycetota bacterium]|nr:YggT family protein [Actinomycetota bacterium]
MDLAYLLILALQVYSYVLIARILLSWVTMFWTPSSALTPVIRVIYELTEPVMSFFRRYIPPVGGFDFSPLVIFILINILIRTIAGSSL